MMLFKGINHLKRNFSAAYSKAMHDAWKNDPSNVHEDWHLVFGNAQDPKAGDSLDSVEL
jgi:2-oxoglutarate dehydrogenase complex dehydrogenase (E1) component-like enzyme